MTRREKLIKCENDHYRSCCLVRCLEAKLDKVEPYSNGFDKLVSHLIQAKEEQKVLARELMEAKYEMECHNDCEE